MMLFRNKMGRKFLINSHLPILICFSIIQAVKGRNCKLNFNKRIIITVSVLLIRATMKVTSHTLPIWSTRRAWKLLGHLLVIAVPMLWWWTWRVEGLIILHLLLLIVVVLMSLVGKLGLICPWQSSLQGVNPINDSNNGAFHPLKCCVSGLLVLRE
jgi:hypothetical protein